MKIQQRDFSGETDKQAMMALARAFPTNSLHVADLPYRLSSWALDHPDHIGLWINAEGQLLAWAVMQTPFWTIDYVYDPRADKNLHRRILAWADKRARTILNTSMGHPMWFANVSASQTDRIRDLEEAGFASQANVGEDSLSKVLLQRSAQIPVADHALPTGFRIRPLAGENEVESYVQLHRAVCESKNMTVEWRIRTLRRPEHRADLDLVAVAPDSRLAAFCVCWLDKDSEKPSGQIEPFGVHRDFRHLGLGWAILSDGLRRLYLCGAERVYVETDKHRNAALELYEAVEFRLIQDVLVYRKDYSDTHGDPEMTAKDVIEIVQLLNQNQIDVYIDGGWGVDALLGEQTRSHADLDIAVQHKDVTQIRTLLEARGYKSVPRNDTRDCNFVLGNDQGHEIDIHSYTFDSAGNLVFGVPYPFDSLNGTGSVNGYPVKCISPEWMVMFHTGYKLDENDYHDVKLLCQHFGITMPLEYKEFERKENHE